MSKLIIYTNQDNLTTQEAISTSFIIAQIELLKSSNVPIKPVKAKKFVQLSELNGSSTNQANLTLNTKLVHQIFSLLVNAEVDNLISEKVSIKLSKCGDMVLYAYHKKSPDASPIILTVLTKELLSQYNNSVDMNGNSNCISANINLKELVLVLKIFISMNKYTDLCINIHNNKLSIYNSKVLVNMELIL